MDQNVAYVIYAMTSRDLPRANSSRLSTIHHYLNFYVPRTSGLLPYVAMTEPSTKIRKGRQRRPRVPEALRKRAARA